MNSNCCSSTSCATDRLIDQYMVFSSQIFFFYFLPLALAVYYGLPRRGRHLALTLLSYIFYGWANPLFVVLLLISTLINYVCGLKIAGERLYGRVGAVGSSGIGAAPVCVRKRSGSPFPSVRASPCWDFSSTSISRWRTTIS